MLSTMRDLERTWNNKFNYPYIFFNDKPFTDEFKQKTQSMTNAKCQYGTFRTLGCYLNFTLKTR
jgi:mannosyltransferase